MTDFIREDWTIFRNVNTLTHKAGVPLHRIRRLVLAEIMDNALDAAPGKKPRWGERLADGKKLYWIEDDGPGIPGSAAQIANLFSIKRPLTTSKVLRVPSRGALGNGIRVIAGSILASNGWMCVHANGARIDLEFRDDGTTHATRVTQSPVQGTRIELIFGDAIPSDGKAGDWLWAERAATFNFALTYNGKTSPWWYDSDTFFELCAAAGKMPLLQLFGRFDSFEEGDDNYERLRDFLGEQKGHADTCDELDRADAEDILKFMRDLTRPVDPRNIGRMFETVAKDVPYGRVMGHIQIAPGIGKLSAELPFVVEALARALDEDGRDVDDELRILINGTPVKTDNVIIERKGKGQIAIFGCGLHHRIERVSSRKFLVVLNVTIPYMPITTDGKEPDLKRFLAEIATAIRTATRKLKSNLKRGAQVSDVLSKYIRRGIAEASGGDPAREKLGPYEFNQRQLFYKMRPYVLREAAEQKDLDYNYFCRWISQYENAHGEIQGMYRDPRGTLYHPHTGETIPLGTQSVREYQRPAWAFNKVLYIEKEGLMHLLIRTGFPERHDCALMSSKGFASRAVRDLIDLLGEDGEEIHVFAIHDADGPGTAIYEALTQGTIARGARKVKVHNLGLEPWEALEMGLDVETFERRKQTTAVADYVRDVDEYGYYYDATNTRVYANRCETADSWHEWLQTHRVELNAMDSPAFLRWLEKKFEDIDAKKVVPPSEVLKEQLRKAAEARVRQQLIEEALAAHDVDDKVAKRMMKLAPEIAKAEHNLSDQVTRELAKAPKHRWTHPLDGLAQKLAAES